MDKTEFESQLKSGGWADPVSVQREGGDFTGDHQHPFHARALITAGEITIEVAGHPTTYCAGDIFDLPVGTPHVETVGPQGVTYYVGRRVES